MSLPPPPPLPLTLLSIDPPRVIDESKELPVWVDKVIDPPLLRMGEVLSVIRNALPVAEWVEMAMFAPALLTWALLANAIVDGPLNA